MNSRILLGLGVAAWCSFVIGVSPASGQCPTDPQPTCEYFAYVIGYEAIAWGNYCIGPQCFDMNYGAEMRIVAVDDEGLFPKTWHVWTGGEVFNTPGGIACEEIRPTGNHDKIVIPEGLHCSFFLQTDNHLYLELLVSYPETGCLGWLECELAN